MPKHLHHSFMAPISNKLLIEKIKLHNKVNAATETLQNKIAKLEATIETLEQQNKELQLKVKSYEQKKVNKPSK
jgi:prefoldin subunit 5